MDIHLGGKTYSLEVWTNDVKSHVVFVFSELGMTDTVSTTYTNAGTGSTVTISYPASNEVMAVKAVGDWELDVLAIPFNSADSDDQWFDEYTDIMSHKFSAPLVIYQHGVKQGAKGMEEKPVVLGKVVPGSLAKQLDGWHVRVILDKSVKYAKAVMDAVHKRAVAVSSDSVGHLARLEINGKMVPYEKNKRGRIAVWPFAGVSLWELGGGNFKPANRTAFALPAMKAIYRDAGIPFPEITDAGLTERSDEPARRARIDAIKTKSKQILARAGEL